MTTVTLFTTAKKCSSAGDWMDMSGVTIQWNGTRSQNDVLGCSTVWMGLKNSIDPQERQPEVNQKHLSWVLTCSSRESSNPNCIPLGNKAQGFLKTREKVCVCCSQGILVMLAAEN